MRPGITQLYIVGLWVLLALSLALARSWMQTDATKAFTVFWWCFGIIYFLLAIIDARGYRKSKRIGTTRKMPENFSLGAETKISIGLTIKVRL